MNDLVAEVLRMRPARDAAGPLMAVFEGSDVRKLAAQCPGLWWEIQKMAAPDKVFRVLLSGLEPGRSVAIHTDAGAHTERRHFPLTVPVMWWDERDGEDTFQPLHWSKPVPFWLPHRVWNPFDEDRWTVIVDVDRYVS